MVYLNIFIGIFKIIFQTLTSSALVTSSTLTWHLLCLFFSIVLPASNMWKSLKCSLLGLRPPRMTTRLSAMAVAVWNDRGSGCRPATASSVSHLRVTGSDTRNKINKLTHHRQESMWHTLRCGVELFNKQINISKGTFLPYQRERENICSDTNWIYLQCEA